MRKSIIILSLLIFSSVSNGQYRIMGYLPNEVYGDYVIVYGHYQSDGTFTMSHCRTNAIGSHIYSNLYYLDINTCQMRPRNFTGAPVQVVP